MDQRRHAAPVDHPGGRETRRGPRASASRTSPTWTYCRCSAARRLPDLLLHQPAERAADVLPRPRLGDHPPERVRGRGRRLPHHRPETEQSLVSARDRPLAPGETPAHHPGPDLRADAADSFAQQDPTWDYRPVGQREGRLAGTTTSTCRRRTPATPRGMSAFGRWMYGPWFWPPAGDAAVRADRQPVLRPGRPDDPNVAYDRPVLRAALIPGTPNISVGMEQFNDTPIVNGAAYPTVDARPEVLPPADPERGERPLLEPAVVRGRSQRPAALTRSQRPRSPKLAAAQSRPASARRRPRRRDAGPELQPGRARLDPDRHRGRLPAGPGGRAGPADHLDHRPDPLRRGQRGPALAAARPRRAGRRRSSTSPQFAGKTLILYNDAPAAFPARVPSYDYYTGAPDLQPAGRSDDPARLRPEHPDDHAGQDRRHGSGRSRST